jgi:ribosomal protein S21
MYVYHNRYPRFLTNCQKANKSNDMKRKRYGPHPTTEPKRRKRRKKGFKKRRKTNQPNPIRKKKPIEFALEYEREEGRTGIPQTVLSEVLIEAIAFGVRQGIPDQLVSDSLIIPGPLFVEWKARGIRYIQALQEYQQQDSDTEEKTKPIAEDRLCGKLVFVIKKAYGEFISKLHGRGLGETSSLWRRDVAFLERLCGYYRIDNDVSQSDDMSLPDETFL